VPKLKSNRAAMKRYRFTAKGKVKLARVGRRHNMHQKSEKNKRAFSHPTYLPAADAVHAHRLLPYGSR
jgi:large subunit ribosomal protein L35